MIVVDTELLDYFRTKRFCERCKSRCWPLEVHHCYRRGMGGGSRLDVALNLVAVCRACHQHLQEGKGGREDGWRIVETREGLAPGQAYEAVCRLLRAKKEARRA